MKVFYYVMLKKKRITFCNLTSNRSRGYPSVISRSMLLYNSYIYLLGFAPFGYKYTYIVLISSKGIRNSVGMYLTV